MVLDGKPIFKWFYIVIQAAIGSWPSKCGSASSHNNDLVHKILKTRPQKKNRPKFCMHCVI